METGFYRLLPNGGPKGEMQPSHLTASESFTTADHTEKNHTFFLTRDKSIISGVWECAPSKVEIESYPVHEMMTVLSGSVTLTNPDGQSDTFKSGDTFFVAKGTKCTWQINETLRKFYMVAA